MAGPLIGMSVAFSEVTDAIAMVAPVDSAVLLLGETGTGKEVIARAIHDASRRRHQRFVAVNCAAIPGGLLESELFGHERGAFTGAVSPTVGRFQAADRGTLFLDEVGDLPLELQPKLLRALQEQQIERLGSGGRATPVDVRVIAATNQDLEEMVQKRTFRADLFYRLNVFPIRYPRYVSGPKTFRRSSRTLSDSSPSVRASASKRSPTRSSPHSEIISGRGTCVSFRT